MFISYSSIVKTRDELEDIIGHALSYQKEMDRRVSPYDTEWNDNNVNQFFIDIEKIDRVYFVVEDTERKRNPWGHFSWELLVRMARGDGHYFISMTLSLASIGCCYDCDGVGNIYFTTTSLVSGFPVSRVCPLQEIQYFHNLE